MIIRFIGTTKQALTLHIKLLGPSWESGSFVFHLTVGLLICLMALLLLPLDVMI
jgi:hypothetical protein